jgi:methylated-DNA-[protein]-cysteine S-methyltransferase
VDVDGEWLAWTVVRAPVRAPAGLAALTVGVTGAGVVLVCFGTERSAGGTSIDTERSAGGTSIGTGATARSLVAEAGRRLGVEPVWEEPGSAGARTATAVDELTGYLAGRRREFELPVDWRLTHGDQRTVLRALYEQVGYGRTVTYGELAVRSGAYPGARVPGQAARRVGMIMGSNPVPVLVPCHRVLAADGLGGFGGGLAVKRWLLEREDALPPMLDLWPDGVPDEQCR